MSLVCSDETASDYGIPNHPLHVDVLALDRQLVVDSCKFSELSKVVHLPVVGDDLIGIMNALKRLGDSAPAIADVASVFHGVDPDNALTGVNHEGRHRRSPISDHSVVLVLSRSKFPILLSNVGGLPSHIGPVVPHQYHHLGSFDPIRAELLNSLCSSDCCHFQRLLCEHRSRLVVVVLRVEFYVAFTDGSQIQIRNRIALSHRF